MSPSSRTPFEPLSRAPVLLRSIVVRTSEPVLPMLNATPGWPFGSESGVPRSLNVASVASIRPPPDT